MDRLLKGLKALADETRLRLIRILINQDLCGKALSRRLGISEAAVSQHVKILREVGVVVGKKRGYWIHYAVQREVLGQIIDELGGMACGSGISADPCHGLKARDKGLLREEVKNMCQSCCERPEKLKVKPEDCTPEQIKKCHGDKKDHPCVPKKEEK